MFAMPSRNPAASKYEFYERDSISSLKELVDRDASLYGEKEVFVWTRENKEQQKSYAELKKDVYTLAVYFNQLPLSKKHFAIVGNSCYEWILSYLSVVIGGNVVIPIDKELSADGIAKLISSGDVDGLLFDDEYEHLAVSLQEKNQCISQCIRFSTILEHCQQQPLPEDTALPEQNVDKMSIILYTSGTTGDSKGVMLSQKNIAADIIGGCAAIDLSSKDRLLSILPIHHTYELTCGILSMMYFGTTIYFNRQLKDVSKNLVKYKPTTMMIVPLFAENLYKKIWSEAKKKGKTKTLQRAIKISDFLLKCGIDVRRKLFADVHASFGGELRTFVCGGAPLSPTLIKNYSSLGIYLIEGYGITECSPLVAVNTDKWRKMNSVGKKVLNTEIKIVDGEICVKSDIVMLGYYKNEAETAASFDGEWFKTGDLGYIDEDDFLFITGRKKNLIILSNGKNVSPEELETQLGKIEGVLEVIVCGDGNAVMAEIYPDYTLENVESTIRECIKEMNSTQPSYKQIGKIKFRDTDFEKTTSKKIKRNYNVS